ncbi:MAG: hypothetical protein ACEQSB_01610 [Undibacterium sp.]
MHAAHQYRVWNGRRVARRGTDSTPAVYTALQRYGFHWIMPFITALEQCPSMSPPHPSGEPWQFEFLIDYRRGENTSPTSVVLRVLPRLSQNFCISIPLEPGTRLTPADVEYCIKQYVL